MVTDMSARLATPLLMSSKPRHNPAQGGAVTQTPVNDLKASCHITAVDSAQEGQHGFIARSADQILTLGNTSVGKSKLLPKTDPITGAVIGGNRIANYVTCRATHASRS